jgi:hypothetical protein
MPNPCEQCNLMEEIHELLRSMTGNIWTVFNRRIKHSHLGRWNDVGSTIVEWWNEYVPL